MPDLPSKADENHFECLGSIDVLILRCAGASGAQDTRSWTSSDADDDVLDAIAAQQLRTDNAIGDESGSDSDDESSRAGTLPNDSYPEDGMMGGMFSLFDGANDQRPSRKAGQQRGHAGGPWSHNNPMAYGQQSAFGTPTSQSRHLPNAPPFGPWLDHSHFSHHAGVSGGPAQGQKHVHFDHGIPVPSPHINHMSPVQGAGHHPYQVPYNPSGLPEPQAIPISSRPRMVNAEPAYNQPLYPQYSDGYGNFNPPPPPPPPPHIPPVQSVNQPRYESQLPSIT